MDKITGIGNALVDVLAHIGDDAVLSEMGLPKGSMQLIDERRFGEISRKISSLRPSRAVGGSTSNTMLALGRLGRTPGFIGKIGNDEYGRFYGDTLTAAGVKGQFSHTPMATGVASTFISADGQRTFATYLGAAAALEPDDLGLEMIRGYRIICIEGYLVQNRPLLMRAIELAHQAGLKVSLDLSSYNVVEQEHALFEALLNCGAVDILFANEEESRAYTGMDPEAALAELSRYCDTVVVKLGAHGSIARSRSVMGKVARVAALKPERGVVDTTAAGDFFTAGFLYALTAGCRLDVCLKAGTLMATQVIQVTGTALADDTWRRLRTNMRTLCNA